MREKVFVQDRNYGAGLMGRKDKADVICLGQPPIKNGGGGHKKQYSINLLTLVLLNLHGIILF